MLVTLGVAFSIALELTVLLSDSIARPLNALHEGIVAVEEGRYDVRIPVTTSDDLGELAHGFNRMVAGLAERERLRQAFGTYLDKEVAEYILSDGFSAEGVEVEVSILFCDVRDFTGFAAQAEATEVVGALNGLFEAIVPIVARHGGHVDKFVGDGLLAVFGAPERVSRPRRPRGRRRAGDRGGCGGRAGRRPASGGGDQLGTGGGRCDRGRGTAQLQRDRRRRQRGRARGGGHPG